MSEAVQASRANFAVTGLAQFLEEQLGFEFARQWAHPDRNPKASGLPFGSVTYLRSDYDLQGREEFEEPAVGDGAVMTKLGIEEMDLQVDIWAKTMDDRFVIQEQLNRLFETGEETDDGALFLSQGVGVRVRYTRQALQFQDTAASAGTRHWRMILDLQAVADIVVVEYVPLMDIVVRLRREGFVTPPPVSNTLGETLTEQDFRPEGT